jgi:hypothetical protein
VANHPCQIAITCPDPNLPLGNYSSDAPEVINYLGFANPVLNPDNPIGGGGGPPPVFFAAGCVSICMSTISQADADACAARQTYTCTIGGGGGPPPTTYTNAAQSCCVPCPDGGQICATVPAGYFVSTTPGLPDQMAAQEACIQANRALRDQIFGNDRECATASCAAGQCGSPVTKCQEANTIQNRSCSNDPAVIASIRASLNAQAMRNAEQDARMSLTCSYGNEEQSGSMFCPGNPGLVASGTVPACKYTSSNAADVPRLNQQANNDLINMLSMQLSTMGCHCPVSTDGHLISTGCALQFQIVNTETGHLVPVPNFI